jgi:hypothetical protein
MSNYKQYYRIFDQYTSDLIFLINYLGTYNNSLTNETIVKYEDLLSKITESFNQSPIIPYKISKQYIQELQNKDSTVAPTTDFMDSRKKKKSDLQKPNKYLQVINCNNNLNQKFENAVKKVYDVKLTPDKLYIIDKLS